MTKIEWADKVWNPVTGCTKVSGGCKNCYAERMSKRLAGRFGYDADEPFKVTLHKDRLNQPRHWRKPSKIFICSMGDIFHKDVPFEFIDQVFARVVAPECDHHIFLVLTKQPNRMLEYMMRKETRGMIAGWLKTNFGGMKDGEPLYDPQYAYLNDSYWPFPNVMLGVSVEDQATADERIPILLQTPAAKRFVSYEPALGPVDFRRNATIPWIAYSDRPKHAKPNPNTYLDLIIMGYESGRGFRGGDIQWAYDTRDQCKAAGTAFYFKQTAGKGPIPEDLQIREWPE